MGIIRGDLTTLSGIISEPVSMRRQSKAEGDVVSAWCCKILLVSIYGAMGGKHGVLSSKTCAQITNDQPHFVYMNSAGKERKILVGKSGVLEDVNNKWVVGRIKREADTMLSCVGLNMF